MLQQKETNKSTFQLSQTWTSGKKNQFWLLKVWELSHAPNFPLLTTVLQFHSVLFCRSETPLLVSWWKSCFDFAGFQDLSRCILYRSSTAEWFLSGWINSLLEKMWLWQSTCGPNWFGHFSVPDKCWCCITTFFVSLQRGWGVTGKKYSKT